MTNPRARWAMERRGAFVWPIITVLLFLAGCAQATPSDQGSTTAPLVTALAGDGQFAEPGAQLPVPFEVLVRDASNLTPKKNVRVEWEVRDGSGGSLSRNTSFTDGAGRTSTTLTLGPSPEAFVVRASFPDEAVDPLDFHARSVLAPKLTAVVPVPVAPGAKVTLSGSDFVPEIDQIDVLFGGVRAQVVSGTDSTLRVRVPDCLNEPQVPVTVSLGPIHSDTVKIAVDGSGTPASLLPGEALRVDDGASLSCTLLEGGAHQRYLAVVHSSSKVGAASYKYDLVLRSPSAAAATGARGEGVQLGEGTGAPPRSPNSNAPGPGRPQAEWDAHVRSLESEAVKRSAGRRRPPLAPPAGTAVPSVGTQRSFNVLNRSGKLEPVKAEVRYVGSHSIVYMDLATPPGGLTDADIRSLGQEFDDPIHPTVTKVFGKESDLDGNGRVVILFTPVVNRLTTSDGNGFVAGFFYGADLLPNQPGSNDGEIFYAIVPDPQGIDGPPRSRTQVMTHVPAVLAHEFTHMVHFNQRVLLRGAPTTDALWLSEALAVTSEELVGDVFAERGDSAKAAAYLSGDVQRARLFLEDPSATSLVVTAGSGTLEERGAGWLFLKYLRGLAGDGILGQLVQTTRTGTENVTAVMNRTWPELLEPWSAALYLDGLGVPVDARYTFSGVDLRSTLSLSGFYPLVPTQWTGGDASVISRLPSSSASFRLLSPTSDAGVAVNLAGPDGGPVPPGSGLGLTLIRLR